MTGNWTICHLDENVAWFLQEGGLAWCLETSARQPLSFSLLPAGLPALDANDPEDKNSPFYYDWHRLRIGGLICAAVLCTVGIIVLMSGKCKCKFSQKPR
uniref:FXYD domain-containing ion transport regulator n=1 Tax=Ursus americanus TaxID=9643 RepID=A0A452QJI5_URSAM